MGGYEIENIMIYFYHGVDVEKVKQKSIELANSLNKKRPDAFFLKIDEENFDVSKLEEYTSNQGLFVSKGILLLDRLCAKKENKEDFLDNLKLIAESENIFIIVEGKLDKVTISKIEKKSEKTVVFDLPEKSLKSNGLEFNAFALADAFGRGNKKESWVLYRKAIDRGEAVEAIHGMIFWKVKTMILNGVGGNDLHKTLENLIDIYHESRRGKYELETKLEEIILCHSN